MSVTIYLGLLIACGLVSDSVQMIMYGPPCVLRGKEYTVYDKLPKPCSRCSCTSQGEVECSRGVCPLVQCVINGKTYQHKDRTDDPCNRCLCFNGEELCSKQSCDNLIDGMKRSCFIGDLAYHDGDRIRDRCWCSDGIVRCNKKASYEEDGNPI